MYWASLGIFKVHIKQLRQTYHSASACRILSKSDHPRQSYDVIIIFSRWRPSAILNYFKVTADDPQSANGGPRSVLKFRLDWTYSFGDNAIFVLWGFGLNLPIYMVVSAVHAQNEGLIYFRGRNWPHILICGGRFAYSSPNLQRRSWSFKNFSRAINHD